MKQAEVMGHIATTSFFFFFFFKLMQVSYYPLFLPHSTSGLHIVFRQPTAAQNKCANDYLRETKVKYFQQAIQKYRKVNI